MTNDTAQTTDAVPALTPDDVDSWVQGYLAAWRTNDTQDIAALFTEDAEYHESPYTTEWIGRDSIVSGWQSRWDWQVGGWDFQRHTVAIVGRVATVTGTGHYIELGDFDNEWTIAFDSANRCRRFDMVNNPSA